MTERLILCNLESTGGDHRPGPSFAIHTGMAQSTCLRAGLPLTALACLLSQDLIRSQGFLAPSAVRTNSSSVIDRFLARADEPLRSYRARRRLEARNERLDLDGWLEARTDLVDPKTLEWSVVAEGGSGSVRDKVLRRALETEAEGLRVGDPARGALTADNYSFTPAGLAGADGGYRVLIDPRRKDKMLLRGSMLLSDPDGDLLQVEGRLSRNPSFWTSAVDVVRRYDRVGGVRVPVEMTSRARVRFAGVSSFRMTWDYEFINGVAVYRDVR